jgi:hypothetical protein
LVSEEMLRDSEYYSVNAILAFIRSEVLGALERVKVEGDLYLNREVFIPEFILGFTTAIAELEAKKDEIRKEYEV